MIEAYVESGEGIDRAGGFAIQAIVVSNVSLHLIILNQGLGGMLIRKIEGDYNNVVGFPAASFFKLLEMLVDEEPDFLEV